MNPTLEPTFSTALRRELVALPAKNRSRSRPVALIAVALFSSVALAATAVAGLRPAHTVADAHLAAPVILNGVGPATVILPEAPEEAAYLRVELTCFDGTRCHTPGGGVDGPADTPKVQRDALPVNGQPGPENAQDLATLDPASGLLIDVEGDTHWRLYAVYTDQLNPKTAPLEDGRILGIPSHEVIPDLIPAVATNGKAGWVNYQQLTAGADPELTDTGTSQAPIPVYDADGTTVIGTADVSLPYR